ncbi:hypothetical protein LCGC14_2961710, partial [marine sediment metagenome]
MTTGPNRLRAVFKRRLAVAGTTAAALVLLATPGAAQAAITIHSFSETPSTTQAGANPNVTTAMVFCANNTACTGSELTDDDVDDVITHLPPGLLANTQAAPRCTTQTFLADACSGATVVGSVTATADSHDPSGTVFSLSGQVYNV